MEYVCTGATLKCTMGTSCPKLKATPKNVTLTGKDQANIADYVSIKNIPSFGRCRSLGYPPTASATAANHGKLTPMPCVPGTCPKWKAIDKDSLICGEPALLKPATLKCMYGGTISIVDPGQTLEIKVQKVSKQSDNKKKEKVEQEIPEELLQEFNELDTEGLSKDSVLDGVQLALDAAGMVPVLGAIPDLINASISVLRGDWAGAGLSIVAAVPGVGDVVGGAKIAYKGAKIAGKVSAKSAKAGKVVAQRPSNVFPIDSARSVNRGANTATKSPSVDKNPNNVYSFEKQRNVKQESAPKIAVGSKYGGSKNTYYTSTTSTSPTNSIDNIGSSSSWSTGTYRANPGNVVQETTNTPRSGSATSKRSPNNKQGDSNNNGEKEPTNLQEYKKKRQEKEKQSSIFGDGSVDNKCAKIDNGKNQEVLNPDKKDSIKETFKCKDNPPKDDHVKGYDGLNINS